MHRAYGGGERAHAPGDVLALGKRGEKVGRCTVHRLGCLASLRVEPVAKIIEALGDERLNLGVEVGDAAPDCELPLRPWLTGTGAGAGKLLLQSCGADRR